jgi:AcrR family transcriptional regulator
MPTLCRFRWVCPNVGTAVPKISAPTVPEHRAHQRQVLLDAAREILISEPAAALTFARVAAAAGLARNSVYEYFSDRAELIVAVVTQEFPRWDRAARDAMATADGPVDQVLAYARTQLELVARGEHRLAAAVRGEHLTDAARRQFRELHRGLTAPLRDALSAAGSDAERRAVYVQGVIDAATTQMENGDDTTAAIDGALAFLRAALR